MAINARRYFSLRLKKKQQTIVAIRAGMQRSNQADSQQQRRLRRAIILTWVNDMP
jgi:hypothetical protein